jgi:hypothetical protein
MEHLYTFFFEYRGGVTIRQVLATRLSRAIEIMVKIMSDEKGISWSDFLEDHPVPVVDIENVWCITALIDDALCMCHITVTERCTCIGSVLAD